MLHSWHTSVMTAGMGRILSAAMVLTIVVPLAVAAIVAVRSWKDAIADFDPPRGTRVRWPASIPDVAGRENVAFTSTEGDSIRGWYVPSRNGAAIALVHGTRADRSQFAMEISDLTGRGFGVLAYDEPGCGESGGRVTWGHSERAALGAAVGWLTRARGVAHVGVLGFSQGSFIAAQVAPDDPRIEALVLEGAIANFTEATWQEFRRWGPLSRWPAYLGRRVAGYAPSDPQPDEVLARFNRPLLIIRGDADRAVPSSHTERLFALAPGPKERWIIPGADHGNYAAVAPVQYAERLAAFFERALLR